MKIKKTIFTLALVCVIALGLLSATAMAASDITSGGTFSTDTTIDLEGATVSVAKPIKVTGGKVIITNGTIDSSVTDLFEVSNGTLSLGENLTVNCTSSGLYAHDGGTITIDGATVTGNGSDYAFAYATGTDSKINVVSGSLVKNGSNHVTLSVDNGASANISGGTVSNDGSTAIVAKQSGTITVSGGEVKTTANYVAVYAVSNGKITVSG